MKRGKMNLKLALGLINLVSGSYQYLWDPFCGQGGLLAVNHVFGDKSMIATDLDRPAIRHTKLNMDWLSGQDKINFNTEIKLLQAERMDAGKLASQSKDSNLLGIIRKIEPGFDFSKTVIVTEGTLGPVYGRILPSKSQLIENLTQIKDLVSKFLGQAQILQIPEIVFCVPFYKLNDGDLSIVDFDQVIPNEYTLDKILPGKEYIDYSRPNTLVGHRIYRLKFNI
jgi:hypothetical protein